MKKMLCFLLSLCVVMMCCNFSIISLASTGTTYYVDAESGDDSNGGLSETDAWKTLEKVRNASFVAGDKILFKKGCTWTGLLTVNGSGQDGNPIVIDQYGNGDAKPAFTGSEELTETVRIYNQKYIEINNLDISANYTTQRYRRGLYVNNEDYGEMKSIHIKDVDVHDVHHNLAYQHNNSYKTTGGIIFEVSGTSVPSYYDDVLIEGCSVISVDREGIRVAWSGWGSRYSNATNPWTPSRNITVKNNTLEDIHGDGITVSTAKDSLVEHNYLNGYNTVNAPDSPNKGKCYNAGMWAYNCDDVIFQYNECTGGISTLDGMSWDVDGFCNRVIYQYNYSYGNEGGTLLLCSNDNWHSKDAVYRYNVSQNEHYYFITAFNHDNAKLYNNVFYTKNGLKCDIMYTRNPSHLNNMQLNNNIFYNDGTSVSDWKNSDNGISYDYNTYYGNYSSTPNDPHKQLQDPKFVSPGTGQKGINTLDGYKLQQTSPCINTGKVISGNCTEDFYGNTISTTHPDRGIYEEPNPPTPPTNLALNKSIEVSSTETNNFLGHMANDGNHSTRWASGYDDNSWLKIDLGEVYDISKVDIYWEAAYGEKYKILLSTDGQTWAEVVDVLDGDGGTDSHTFNSSQARYVKMQGVKRATQWGFSIYEIEVFE